MSYTRYNLRMSVRRSYHDLYETASTASTGSLTPSPKRAPRKAAKKQQQYNTSSAHLGRRSYRANAEPQQDLYATPTWAVSKMVTYILAHVIKNKVIWEPCHGNGRITDVLRAAGYKVIATDLYTLPEHRNFMEWEPTEHWDILVTNHPTATKISGWSVLTPSVSPGCTSTLWRRCQWSQSTPPSASAKTPYRCGWSPPR